MMTSRVFFYGTWAWGGALDASTALRLLCRRQKGTYLQGGGGGGGEGEARCGEVAVEFALQVTGNGEVRQSVAAVASCHSRLRVWVLVARRCPSPPQPQTTHSPLFLAHLSLSRRRAHFPPASHLSLYHTVTVSVSSHFPCHLGFPLFFFEIQTLAPPCNHQTPTSTANACRAHTPQSLDTTPRTPSNNKQQLTLSRPI